MDNVEKYRIYKETKICNQINDKNREKRNKIYDVVIDGETDRTRTRNINA